MSSTRGRSGESEALRDTLLETVKANVEAAQKRLAEATEEAAKVTAAAEAAKAEVEATKAEVEEMRRVVQADRAMLEAEKAAMEKAHDFQCSKICLDVGGHKFTTSRQTLTTIPDTYFCSMFSGRFELTPDGADGSYFLDRDGRHFYHVLNFLRDHVSLVSFTVSSDMTEAQRKELDVELALLDRVMPVYAQERVGHSLLNRACLVGTERALRTAMAQSGVLVFVMGSTTPFLNEKFQDLRWVITDRVVNGSPVWAAEGGKWFMFRVVDNMMSISDDSHCAEGRARGSMYNTEDTADVVAPTELPSDEWVSYTTATLATHYASADRLPDPDGELVWAPVPAMRITAVHGLSNDVPAMAEALAKLAALGA